MTLGRLGLQAGRQAGESGTTDVHSKQVQALVKRVHSCRHGHRHGGFCPPTHLPVYLPPLSCSLSTHCYLSHWCKHTRSARSLSLSFDRLSLSSSPDYCFVVVSRFHKCWLAENHGLASKLLCTSTDWVQGIYTSGGRMTLIATVGLVLVVGLAWVLRADPWKVSMGRGVAEFTPHYIAAPVAGKYEGVPRDMENKLRNGEITWRGQLLGPESLAFDSQGRGPYTGVSDGRVLRYDGQELGWTTFAYTSQNRSAACAPKSPLAPNFAHEHVCGRPLGLRFNKATGDLWIADAYLGIMKVGAEGGQAELVLNAIDDVRMKFVNDLDFDDEGNLYFTDSSTHWQRRQFLHCLMEADDTGRLIKYNPATTETTVVLNNLRFSNGVAVSKDGTFLVVAEGRLGRLLRYWLKGEKAGTHELFADLPGYPDNVRRNDAGDFWIACHCPRTPLEAFLGTQPLLRKLIFRLPVPVGVVYKMLAGKPHGLIFRYGPDGEFKEALEDEGGLVASKISEVEEHDGKLYIGSVLLPQVVVYTLPKP